MKIGAREGALAGLMVVVLAIGVAASAAPTPPDSGTSSQLDRIDHNAYAACLNAAGTSASRLARCEAPPTAAPTTTAPPPTTSPPATGFPTAASTGVPAGTALVTVGGDLHAAGGSTIDARDIQGSLIVDGNDVHVTRTRIHGVVFNGSHTGLTLIDTEITANPGQDYSISNFPPITGSYTLTRVHVHRWQDGPRTDQGTVLIQDSLSDDLSFATGEHPDAVQQFCGSGCAPAHVTLRHDTLSGCTGNSSDKGNSAIFWSDHPPAGSTLELFDSLLSCGQFTIRVNDTGTGSGNNPGVIADIHDNTVVANSWAFGAAECGNASPFDPATNSGVKWSNNKLDTGAIIPSPC